LTRLERSWRRAEGARAVLEEGLKGLERSWRRAERMVFHGSRAL
jgi:hypothetical protein